MGSKPKQMTKKAAVKETGPLYNPILSTNGGRHAYICRKDRKTPLLATDSDDFAIMVIEQGYLPCVEELAQTSTAADVWAETFANLKPRAV